MKSVFYGAHTLYCCYVYIQVWIISENFLFYQLYVMATVKNQNLNRAEEGLHIVLICTDIFQQFLIDFILIQKNLEIFEINIWLFFRAIVYPWACTIQLSNNILSFLIVIYKYNGHTVYGSFFCKSSVYFKDLNIFRVETVIINLTHLRISKNKNFNMKF